MHFRASRACNSKKFANSEAGIFKVLNYGLGCAVQVADVSILDYDSNWENTCNQCTIANAIWQQLRRHMQLQMNALWPLTDGSIQFPFEFLDADIPE